MSGITSLARRCCLLYFRDRGAVFFSLMASLIVVMLYLLFLRDSMVSGNVRAQKDEIRNIKKGALPLAVHLFHSLSMAFHRPYLR